MFSDFYCHVPVAVSIEFEPSPTYRSKAVEVGDSSIDDSSKAAGGSQVFRFLQRPLGDHLVVGPLHSLSPVQDSPPDTEGSADQKEISPPELSEELCFIRYGAVERT